MPKPMTPEDVARILRATLAGSDEDEGIVFHVVSSLRGEVLMDGPYVDVRVNEQYPIVELVKKVTVRGELEFRALMAIVEAILKRLKP